MTAILGITLRKNSLPLVASLALHAVLAAAIIWTRVPPPRRAPRVAESAETLLAISPPPAPPSIRQHAPAPVVQEIQTELPTPPPPQPRPEPAVITTMDPDPEPDRRDVPEPKPVFAIKPQEDAPAPAASSSAPPPPAPIRFAGMSAAPAARVVYVVDASGAMASTLSFAFAELERSVARLSESQEFQVILCRDAPKAAGTEVFDESGLVRATSANKLELAKWLNSLTPSGRSDPLPAITAALRLRPELILVLTRSIRRSGRDTSWGAGVPATLAALDSLNPIDRRTMLRPVVIKTVQFLDEDPTGLLAAIAEAHGDGEGSYRVVGLEELKGGARR